MDDLWGLVLIFVLAMTGAFILGIDSGANHITEKVTETCGEIGKMKVEKKWYECKPIEVVNAAKA